jgi:N-acetyl-anhydromuramyl-L-alanine amidase AmpD
LCKNLKKKYSIKKENFLGHSDIAPLRKLDPGEKFPWKKLSNT